MRIGRVLKQINEHGFQMFGIPVLRYVKADGISIQVIARVSKTQAEKDCPCMKMVADLALETQAWP